MSQFPQTQPSSSLTRPRFAFDTTSAPTVGVQAPSIPNPNTGGDQGMAQLGGAIRLLTDVAGNLGDRQARMDRKAEIDADKQERAAEKARISLENSMKNAASQSSIDELPIDLNNIATGTWGMKDEDQGDPEMMADRLLRENAKGFGPVYDKEEAAAKKSKYIRAILKKGDLDQKAAVKTQSDGFFSRLVTSDDPEHLDSVFADLEKQPGMADHANGVLAKAAVELAKNYTAENDTEWAIKAITQRLNGEEEGRVGLAERLLAGAKEKAQTERQQSFANEAADIFDKAIDDEASPEDVKTQIEEAGTKWGIESRFVKAQLGGVNSAIKRQRDEQKQRMEYEAFTNRIATNNTMAVAAILTNAGDATTQQSGMIQQIDFQPIPGLPPELGGEKAQRARFVEEARKQSKVNLTNLDNTDPVNVNQWTRYVRAMAGVKHEDEQIKSTLLSLDFGSTGKEGAQVNNPQNTTAAQMYLMVASINPNYAADMVKGNPQAKKFYDSVAIDMLTPGAKLTPQIINTAVAKGQVKPEDEAKPGEKVYAEVLKAAPNLSPSMVQYAVRTYNEQKGKAGALEYAVQEAQGRGVQLWQSWAGWANPIVPFTRANNSPTRPLVDLGMLSSEDPSVRPQIGTAMESMLEQRAKDINKINPLLKIEKDQLGLNYIGNGVWEVEGLVAGELDHKYDHMFYVTDAQVREQVQKNADTQKVESLADLEKQLAEAKRYQREVESAARTGDPVNPTKLLPNGGMMMNGYQNGDGLVSIIETKIKVRKLQESKKKP